jgi:hypothetical protein
MLFVARERGHAAAHDNSEVLRDKIEIEYAPYCSRTKKLDCLRSVNRTMGRRRFFINLASATLPEPISDSVM